MSEVKQSPGEQQSLATERCCSYAITGPNEAFQAIYICRTCSSNDIEDLFCVCQACADQCHRDHEGLEYVGMGPSYCDCNKLKGGYYCCILKQSIDNASQLGIGFPSESTCNSSFMISSRTGSTIEKEKLYIRDLYKIAALEEDSFCKRLQYQAQELVKYSKNTFWLDAVSDESLFCDLELLAWTVFRQHLNHYDSFLKDQRRQNGIPIEAENGTEILATNLSSDRCVGAEWWVQVKNVSLPPPTYVTASTDRLQSYNNGSEAVDLHYDKDETLAEVFGLGLFPVLSTVTYLTNSVSAPPTVVFNTRYEETGADSANAISEMFVSPPSRGKHLVFDGRLLHGAPTHFALRPSPCKVNQSQKEKLSTDNDSIRITFLVNLWLNHKPAGISVLPTEIREALKNPAVNLPNFGLKASNELVGTEFEVQPIQRVEVNEETELPSHLRGRIVLPFVGGNGTTWGSENEDDAKDDVEIVIETYPPPRTDLGATLVCFGPGLEAYLANLDDGSETGEEDGDDSFSSQPDLDVNNGNINDSVENSHTKPGLGTDNGNQNDSVENSHANVVDDDRLFGSGGENDGNDINRNKATCAANGKQELDGEEDEFLVAEHMACRERYRVLGYHEGYNSNEHQNDLAFQKGFESGYNDSYDASKSIGFLIGNNSAIFLKSMIESSSAPFDDNNTSQRLDSKGSFQHDDDANDYLFVVKIVRDFLVSRTSDGQVRSSTSAYSPSLEEFEQKIRILLQK